MFCGGPSNKGLIGIVYRRSNKTCRMQFYSSRSLKLLKLWHFVLKTAQAEAQFLQHLDMRSLGQVVNGKLDALNIRRTYITWCILNR